ncbi:MAG: PilZ domain-containing protein [Bryobacteraceae bacterium]
MAISTGTPGIQDFLPGKEQRVMEAIMALDTDTTDRRSAVRFPIEQEVRYKVFNRNTIEVGSGRTINMSSNGILFTTQRALNPGERLELAVNWPAYLDNRCALKLVTTGRVVRSEDGKAAIAIERYEFRTQGSHGLF